MHKSFLTFVLLGFAASSWADDTPAPQAYTWFNALTLEAIDNMQGGIATGTRGFANVDVCLTIDTGLAEWWNNGTVFIYALGDYGKSPDDLAGDMQGLSNITADNAAKIYEFWYQHSFLAGDVKVLAGLHDYNSTFYALDSAALFTLPPFGIGSDTSQVTPSIFPTTSTAVLLNFQHDKFYLLMAVYDGIPGDPDNPKGTHIQFNKGDGVFKAVELGVLEENQFKLAAGAWQHTAMVVNPVDGLPSDDNNGHYVIGELSLSEHLTTFFQYGRANKNKNQLDVYWGAGATLKNNWVEGDGLGLAVAKAHNSSSFLTVNPWLDSAETIWEFTYFRPVVQHVNVQGSLYYVQNPGMEPALDNALAMGVRLYIDF